MSERTHLSDLSKGVVDWFRANADRLGLRADSIEARYILNWGGFVNASFTITDGQVFYHLKLADEEWSLSRLDQWRELNELLSKKYRAPRMLDWVEIPRTGFSGPLFEHIPGQPANLAAKPRLLREVLALLDTLHNDVDLAGWLAEGEDDLDCADYFCSVYIERFDEDLIIIANNLPPFVSLHLLDWMMGETRELEGLARSFPAFLHQANSPTHGDLWSSNILLAGEGDWRIIDWDDLALGDPALEYGIVLGPLWRDGNLSLTEVEALLPPGEDLRERFRLCLRAFLLDGVIDNLADWVECSFTPEHQEKVRADKELAHRKALELYQNMYGAVPE